MIIFLTQYYKGIGHANRVRLIAKEIGKTHDITVVDQLYKPPINFENADHVAMMKDFVLPAGENVFQFIQQKQLVAYRIKKWIELLDNLKPKIIIIEGFPFCRQQFAFEFFNYIHAAKERNIKLLCSIRDFPYDEPHSLALQDWVAITQNYVLNKFFDEILVHGDKEILPLTADTIRIANSHDILQEIADKIYYTGYVADKSLNKHKSKNNIVYVSCGLNKDEVFLIFREVIKAAKMFPDLQFVMPFANDQIHNLTPKQNKNIKLTNYISNLAEKIVDCKLFITYGGYNSTMEVLQTQCPAILIPRQNGKKLEQFIRCYQFEPLNVFKVCNSNELNKLHTVIEDALQEQNFPAKFNYDMEGAVKSAERIIHHIT
jgi:predicted glycosyltransferase